MVYLCSMKNNREHKIGKVFVRVFKPCKSPSCSPEKISQGGSKYWYGIDKFGKFMIRKSDHWGQVGDSYYLFSKQITDICEVGEVRTGKTYL